MVGLVCLAGAWSKRHHASHPETYAGAFTDFDFFVLAIGSDLIEYHRATATPVPEWLSEIPVAAEDMLRKGVIPTATGGWVFEPGVWRDYPDYRFAGSQTMTAGMAPRLVDGIAGDASHFSRWPLWLRSFAGAAPTAKSRAYFESLQSGLRRQFVTRVLVLPSRESRIVRLRNFMDGNNGVYRYGYASHPSSGYGPFQLSGTAFYGWWAFLGGVSVTTAYRDMAAGFPYSDAELKTYLGPWTNPLYYRNGRNLFLVSLATQIAASVDTTSLVVKHSGTSLPDSVESAWGTLELPMLQRSLWQGGDAESAQYVLMLPLHAAFWFDQRTWRVAFDSHFRRFSEAPTPYRSAPLLGRLHYLYFASRYLVLTAQAGSAGKLPPRLLPKIEDELHALWTGYDQVISSTGWGEPAFRDFRSELRWKLSLQRHYKLSADVGAKH